MISESLPEGIITRFRTLSLERIGRVETTWNALVQGVEDEEAVRAMSRDVHTLKGDSRIIGFDEVHLLSHKLEELLALAAQLQYRVSEDFELVVTMATQFVGMLLRKKSGGTGGIDLPGFVRQVDEVLRETRVLRRVRPTGQRKAAHRSAEGTADRMSEAMRLRIATAATNVFLEYLSARTTSSRARLRDVWQTLSREVSQQYTVSLGDLLSRHIAAGAELADELGKQVVIRLELEDVRLEARAAEAVDLAVVHLVRNAIDHGIETPDVRVAAGKSPNARVRIYSREHTGQLEIVVEDDGGGIDLERVREKAVERDLMSAEQAAAAKERELFDVLFQPGFTTKCDVTDVSGRGVGLDAVKAEMAKVGGTVQITHRAGGGTSIVLASPQPVRYMRVFQFFAPGNAVNLAISARWAPSTEEGLCEDAIDPISAIELVGGSRQTMSGLSPPPSRDLVLRLRWGFLEIALRTASEPQLVTAERFCPTPDDYPVEVVMIDGTEALLLRPEHVSNMIRRTRDH